MDDKIKEKIKNWVLIIMIASIIGAFVLFFLGHYKLAMGLSGFFMALAYFISEWTSDKNADYVYRSTNKNKW
ncbi:MULTISPECIES: hypothetical protein [unclassified Bacillus (in: firmicutes)]|uniref:hypothetical protein n=1 Tax=unclassified Bacillus (in: firmicutes) TaxID=185979 RepID=UPI0008EDA9D8|nr:MULTISPECIES: hypothetical protein [unclassified Bacillus (in: firmicutes)]SFA85762.1 hypothetical protein SAMN02799634_10257 [Bacillus sp. UNCCL13]SFQ83518.1 hypothetical protein SAMN04488577_2176 [Bacillus sp. cl95]